ncbi:MAG: hypothetical protein IJ222_10205 [Bacteroidales bacterium]|nr:hypothetical protein [Bacteroidales bacterium]
MKKILPPILLALCVFSVSMFSQRYTLLLQECDGLFLATPDYFSWAFGQPFPISQVVSDFLVQFYRLSPSAPFIVTGIVVLLFLLVRGILRATPLRPSLPASLVAVVFWYVTAVKASPKPAVAAILCLLPVCGLSLFFRKRKGSVSAWADVIASSAVVLIASMLIVFNPGVRHAETWAKVKNATMYRKWAVLNASVTPELTAGAHEFTPFALLSLDAQHKLGSRMFSYPVYEENDLDMCREGDYYNSIFFRAAFHSLIGCHNEAIHNYSQLATGVPHGTSFMVLRSLIAENYLAGNFVLVEKYCKILDRSQTHGKYTSYYRKAMKGGSPHPADSLSLRTSVPVITDSPSHNLMVFMADGIPPVNIMDRLLCTFMLQRDLTRFREALRTYGGKLSELPVHHQEALALADPACMEELSANVQTRYRGFMAAFGNAAPIPEQQSRFGDTYWFYYYYLL